MSDSIELRKFGISFGLAMSVLGLIMFLRGRPHFAWFTCIGSLHLFFAIVYPKALIPFKMILDFIILLIGRLVNLISSMLVFYLIFTPIGITLRLFGKDLLDRRIDKEVASYWRKRQEDVYTEGYYERMG